MAKIGLRGFWTGTYTESAKGHITFSNSKKVAKAVQLTENRNVSEVSLYADDEKDDSAYSVTGVSLGITPNGLTLDELQEMLGLTEDTVSFGTGEYKLTGTGFSNEGERRGLGIWATERISGAQTYRVFIYPNVKFRPAASKELNTKGASMTFATETVTGEAFADKSGNYVYEKEFATEYEAVTFLNAVFGITGEQSFIEFVERSLSVAVDGTVKASIAKYPHNLTVTFGSSDTDKATVDTDGVVTGVSTGAVIVSASATIGNKTVTDYCMVEVV